MLIYIIKRHQYPGKFQIGAHILERGTPFWNGEFSDPSAVFIFISQLVPNKEENQIINWNL